MKGLRDCCVVCNLLLQDLALPQSPNLPSEPILASAAPLRRSLPVSPQVGEVLSICTQLFDIFKFPSKIEINGVYMSQRSRTVSRGKDKGSDDGGRIVGMCESANQHWCEFDVVCNALGQYSSRPSTE